MHDPNSAKRWPPTAIFVVVCLVIPLGGTSCAVPELQIDSIPSDTQLFLDGVQVPETAAASDSEGEPSAEGEWKGDPERESSSPPPPPVSRPLEYYGTTTLSGRLAEGQDLVDARLEVRIDEPITPWIFPLDFAYEVLTYPFSGDRYAHQVSIHLAPRPEQPTGVTPAGVAPLRARARRAMEAR